MLLTALYYASICSDASALLLCSSIIRQGLADGHHSISITYRTRQSFNSHFFRCACYTNMYTCKPNIEISTGHYPTAVL